jgi:hypothetical protein
MYISVILRTKKLKTAGSKVTRLLPLSVELSSVRCSLRVDKSYYQGRGVHVTGVSAAYTFKLNKNILSE